MRGGWREVGVLLSFKSVTQSKGMISLPEKPGSLLLLFRSQTHSPLFSLFFPPLDYKSFSVWGDFSIITSRIGRSSSLSLPQQASVLLFYCTCKYASIQGHLPSKTRPVRVRGGARCVVNMQHAHAPIDGSEK